MDMRITFLLLANLWLAIPVGKGAQPSKLPVTTGGQTQSAGHAPQTQNDSQVLRRIASDVDELKKRKKDASELWIPTAATLLVAIGGWILAIITQRNTAASQRLIANEADDRQQRASD